MDSSPQEPEDNYIADSGARCPGFVTETMFSETDDNNVHRVTFPDPEPYTRGDGRITVQAIIATDDGGIVTYDDGVSIFNRMFTDPERAVEVFRSTVALTSAESEGPAPRYDPGFRPVEFDDISIEVQN